MCLLTLSSATCSPANCCPIVSAACRHQVFNAIHNLSHPAVWAMCSLTINKFVWKGIHKQVSDWAKNCFACQTAKIQCYVKAPLKTFAILDCCFDHVHVNLVGPLPSLQGFIYLFTMMDHFTRWPEAVPLTSMSLQTCTHTFISHWVACFGVPSTVTYNRGAQFMFELCSALSQLLGTSPHHTAAYHPQSNGLVEHFY